MKNKRNKPPKRNRKVNLDFKQIQIDKFKRIEQMKLELEKERLQNPELLRPDVKPIKLKSKKTNKSVHNKLKRDKKKRGNKKRLLQTSRGELLICNYLTQMNIEYKREYIYADLTNPETEQPLRFDFYLPKYNLLIEFDGAQHFMYVKEFYGHDEFIGKKKLENQQFRDRLKDTYCEIKNIPLLRISYRDINKIKDIIFGKLRELKKKSLVSFEGEVLTCNEEEGGSSPSLSSEEIKTTNGI